MILEITLHLVIGILIIALLLIVFFVSYRANKKTPIPKGCEDIMISKQNCGACKNYACQFHMEEEIQKEIDKEKLEDK